MSPAAVNVVVRCSAPKYVSVSFRTSFRDSFRRSRIDNIFNMCAAHRQSTVLSFASPAVLVFCVSWKVTHRYLSSCMPPLKATDWRVKHHQQTLCVVQRRTLGWSNHPELCSNTTSAFVLWCSKQCSQWHPRPTLHFPPCSCPYTVGPVADSRKLRGTAHCPAAVCSRKHGRLALQSVSTPWQCQARREDRDAVNLTASSPLQPDA